MAYVTLPISLDVSGARGALSQDLVAMPAVYPAQKVQSSNYYELMDLNRSVMHLIREMEYRCICTMIDSYF